jgi:hypothetical protein
VGEVHTESINNPASCKERSALSIFAGESACNVCKWVPSVNCDKNEAFVSLILFMNSCTLLRVLTVMDAVKSPYIGCSIFTSFTTVPHGQQSGADPLVCVLAGENRRQLVQMFSVIKSIFLCK